MLKYPQTEITMVEKAKRVLSGATEIQKGQVQEWETERKLNFDKEKKLL